MIETQSLVTQHREIEEVINEIRGDLNRQETAKDARHTRRLLCNLISRLNNHMLCEAAKLYSDLRGSGIKSTRDLAAEFEAEMEEIRTSCLDFFGKWEHVEVIEEDTDSFSEDANTIFNILTRRFAREESELYSKLDSLAKTAIA